MLGSLGVRSSADNRSVVRTFLVGLGIGTSILVLLTWTGRAIIQTAGVLEASVRVLLMASVAMVVAQALGASPIQSRWQVPERWRRSAELDVLGLIYGLLLGLGMLNAVVLTAFWFVLLSAVLVPPWVSAILWFSYALTRHVGFLITFGTIESTVERRTPYTLLTWLAAALTVVSMVSLTL